MKFFGFVFGIRCVWGFVLGRVGFIFRWGKWVNFVGCLLELDLAFDFRKIIFWNLGYVCNSLLYLFELRCF